MAVFSDIRHIETEMLIVGAGVAGMMAATAALRVGITPVVATKGTYASGSSSMAKGGHSIAIGHSDPDDNVTLYYEDIFEGSYQIGNRRLIDVVAEESISRTLELDEWGLGLVKLDDGRYEQKYGGSPHRFKRMVHCGRLMGKPLMASLANKTKSLGVKPLEHLMLVDLIYDQNKVNGAWGFSYRTGEPIVISAKTTVISTGGAPQIHTLNDSPPTITGDGYAMAYRAGAELIDMEFIDYQLVCAAPEKLAGYGPYSTGLLGGGSYLKNKDGERFMAKIDPENMEHSTRALINRGLAIEVFEGRGTENNAVYIDCRHVFEDLNNGPAAEAIKSFKKGGVDVSKEPLEVASCPHTYLGGIRIDEWGRTNVEGLYAGGEAAGGIHGANRLSGMALSDSYVFGYRSGMAAALESREMDSPKVNIEEIKSKLASLLNGAEETEDASMADPFRKDVQDIIVKSLGQVRSRESLNAGLAQLRKIENQCQKALIAGKNDRQKFDSLRRFIETRNVISVGTLLGTAANSRDESRGGHFRIDEPEQKDEFEVNIVLSLDDDEIKVELTPVPERDDIAEPPPGNPDTDLDYLERLAV